MKKFLALCLMAIFTVAVTPVESSSQSKALQKELKKEYKKKIKEYKKEGWKIAGSSRTLEVALLLHYEKMKDENCKEIPGEVSSAKSDNLGRAAALNNACIHYASLAGSYLKGRVVSDGALNQSSEDGSEEFDKMYQAYERLVSKELRGELTESYSIYRDNGNGTKALKTFFIVNEEAAANARLRAWEQAKRESEAAQKYAEQVSGFISEGFAIE